MLGLHWGEYLFFCPLRNNCFKLKSHTLCMGFFNAEGVELMLFYFIFSIIFSNIFGLFSAMSAKIFLSNSILFFFKPFMNLLYGTPPCREAAFIFICQS